MPPAEAPSDFQMPEATYCGPLSTYPHSVSLRQGVKGTGYPNLPEHRLRVAESGSRGTGNEELLFPHQTTRQACFRMGAAGPGDAITSIRTPIKPLSCTVSQVRLKSEALTPTPRLHLPSSLTGLTAPVFRAAFTFQETGSTGQ